MLRIVLTTLFIIVCVALVVVVMMQKDRDSGLGSLAGSSDSTYWGKNSGRSMEGVLIKLTRGLSIAALVLAIVLNLTKF